MTGRYTHSRLYDLAAAVKGLPSFALAGPGADPWPRPGRTGNYLAQTLAYRRIVGEILRDKLR